MSNPDSASLLSGTLYIVGTPIGNLEDMSFRAVRILQSVDLIAAEDTRHTAKLLRHFQIQTPQISYHQHNTNTRTPELIARLQQGQTVALVTDAGMPGISDPGYDLVHACVEAEISVVPIPGPNAAIAALTVSGLPADRFCFEGFLPVKGRARQERLMALQFESRTVIVYEAPHRLRQTLEDFMGILGSERPLVIARELTKRHETVWRGSLVEAIALYQTQEPRGEFTLVLAGNVSTPAPPSEAEIKLELQALIKQGLSRSQASREVAHHIPLSRQQVYQLALKISIDT